MPNRPGATPRLDRLLRVVPIIETRPIDGGPLLVVSLESHAEGFLVHTQIGYDPDDGRIPEILFEAVEPVDWTIAIPLG